MILLFVTVVIILLCLWKLSQRPNWAPPGPFKLPILGSRLWLDTGDPSSTLTKWSRKFGVIYYLELGSAQFVVLSDHKLICDALSKVELSFRAVSPSSMFTTQGKGLVHSNGELWKESRRFTLHNIRNFCFKGSALENALYEQTTGLMEHILKPNQDKPLDVGISLNIALVNTIWYSISSIHLDICDTSAMDVIRGVEHVYSHDLKYLHMLEGFPFLISHLPKLLFDSSRAKDKLDNLLDSFFMPVIEQHRMSLDVNAEPNDYIDALLQEQMKLPELFTDYHIKMCLISLFFTSNETTACTFRWALCFLCNEPGMMRRIQEEIDCVTGQSRPVCLADRTNMPFTEAFLLETQRRADILPLIRHSVISDVKIGGVQIPPGVTVIANISSVLRSPHDFPNPDQFNPNRFLSNDGKFTPDKKIIPFSAGKRKCIGETVARSQLFLFLTLILQKYSFRWPNGFRHPLTRELDSKGPMMKPTAFKLLTFARTIS